ncbi:MAG: nucleotide sugar dehydrogenase [Clostridiales bacterium]|nr:nucleotide sugar dehydrogenase [Clostridiales bacterium]
MITVFGLGFVGLTTALGFAHLGYKVYGIDVDENRKEILKSGKIPFYEPYMEDELNKSLNKNFLVTDNIREAIKNSEYIFYCVGTPYGNNGSADLTYLFNAIDSTIEAIEDKKFRVIVVKSTVPPSTTAEKVYPYVKSKGEVSDYIGVANNPEFLREGHCFKDFMEADRIVLGVNDERSKEMLVSLYKPMNIPIKCVTHSTGEFIKYLSNTLLATLISYSNEMAEVAETIGGIEISEAFKILHMDKRWNNCNMTSYVYPGCGYGGYCLPKDTSALYSQSVEKGYTPKILQNVIKTNNNISKVIGDRIIKNLDKNSTIGILGLSFKPDSDDVRDTPAAKIIRDINSKGYNNIVVYDPVAKEEFKNKYPDINVSYCMDVKDLYDRSDIIALVTAWDEFKMVKNMGNKKIIDCRYML